MSQKIINRHYNNTQTYQLSHNNTWLLWCCMLVNIVSLSAEISVWMLAILALILSWQALFNNANTSPNISSILLKLCAISGCLAIAITANESALLLSMVHLLTFAYVLKAFEIKRRKDFYQLFLLGIFLLASALIYRQSLGFSIFIIFALILNLVVLLQVFSVRTSLVSSFKAVSMLLLQSLLLAIILFIVFPRLSPFWQVPNAKSAKTGLSSEVSPGDIANLALSNELAFRVDFKGNEIPQYANLYWRAMTLENYDGRKWSRASSSKKNVSFEQSFTPNTSGEGIRYDVIVEPNYQTWLFGLSVISTDDEKIKLLSDYTIQSRTDISQISQYQAESFLQAPLDLTISNTTKMKNLFIVKNSNPKLEKLALSLISEFPDPIDRSNAVLSYFSEQEYFYTLSPPLLVNNSLDQFFFDTKAGFCVHYASAYTYLMRAAGIPARVVTGYLGGEYNNASNSQSSEQGGHLSIYQYDAHAWAEIWLDGIGWKRVDPTSAVDPKRVNSGWSSALLSQQSSLNNDFFGLHQFKRIAWLNQLRLQLDAIDYQWTRWVIGYSNKKQIDFLNKLFGENVKWKTAITVALTLITMMGLIMFFYRFNYNVFKQKKVTLWLKLYQKALIKLSKKGLNKPLDMTPANFAQLVAKQHPEISKEFIEFTHTFESLMYHKLNLIEQDELFLQMKSQYGFMKARYL